MRELLLQRPAPTGFSFRYTEQDSHPTLALGVHLGPEGVKENGGRHNV